MPLLEIQLGSLYAIPAALIIMGLLIGTVGVMVYRSGADKR